MAGIRFDMQMDDHTKEVLQALQTGAEKAMEMCGLVAEGYAKALCPVDTGQLRNSITHVYSRDGEKHEEHIGTNVEHGPYVEFGTGIYYDGGGRQSPWTYQDRNGEWHMTNGQRAQPYLRPAIADHLAEYQQIITDELKG